MIRIFISLVFALAVMSSGANAQQQDPAARAAAMKQKLKDDLKFTDAQADSVVSIQQEFRPQMREIFMDQSLSPDDKKAKLAPINAQMNKRLQAALGPDLFKQYQEWRQKNRPQIPGGGGNS